MKTLRQYVGSVIAIALLGAFVSVGASSAQAQAKKTGWWIRVNTTKSVATLISFQIGTHKRDSQNWRTWKAGQRVEFDLPANFRNAAELYIRAHSDPHQKAYFCVFYRDHGVENFDFDGDSDHHMKQSDSDDECHP
ncbi:MAG TPA: hypothetical protein VGM62_05465 [Chthoniobacterales bacterium]|jgi:hypothetical protein